MQILHVVGARPNFMKVAPVMAAIATRADMTQQLVHTGQHYDANMSDVFWQELGLPQPDVNLGVGSGSHAVQTAQIMTRLEEVVLAQRPDLVLVYGDINSTVAAALVCAKLLIPVGHVEAGLRSFDRTMPEEINRLLTDQIADLLFTPSADGNENLLREGVAHDKIYLVGNVMIDTLVRLLPQAEARWEELLASLRDLPPGWESGGYCLVTLHRPSNVDQPDELRRIMDDLGQIAQRLPVLFPIHPRTRQRLQAAGLDTPTPPFYLTDPVGYLEFLALQRHATLVVTDSGGIQEETTFLGVPCITLRKNTERPITVTLGTNVLVGQDSTRLHEAVDRVLQGETKPSQIPPLWDGKAGERIADVLATYEPSS